MKELISKWCFVLGVCLSLQAIAEPVTLPATEQFELKNQAGEVYQIMVSLPEQSDKQNPAPVLYLLDGNSVFAAFHDARRMEQDFADCIIVAVAYPTDKPFDFYRRSYDFSPPVPSELNDPPQGGQGGFLNFLQNTLQPEIAHRYNVNPDRQALYGHSFGGMFTLYAMYTQSDLVNHYIVSSPSLWWHHRYLWQHEQAFTAKVSKKEVSLLGKSLLLLVAENDPVQEKQDIILLAGRMNALSQYGLRSAYYRQSGEDHMSLPVTVAHRVLRQAFSPRIR